MLPRLGNGYATVLGTIQRLLRISLLTKPYVNAILLIAIVALTALFMQHKWLNLHVRIHQSQKIAHAKM